MLIEEKIDRDIHIVLIGDFLNAREIMKIYLKDSAFKEYVYKSVNIYLVFYDNIFVGYYKIYAISFITFNDVLKHFIYRVFRRVLLS